ncbi:MAG TPA: ABC transporter substrate-binding protein, partial [Anaerolineae bacterium]
MKKTRVSKKYMEKIHPYIPEAYSLLEQGRVSRREFLRVSTLLGMSAGVATVAAACGAGGQPAPAGEEIVEPDTDAPDVAEDAGEEAAPTTGEIKRGGTFRSSMNLQGLDHPARLSWVEGANIVRQFGEYLTETGVDNITRPYLLENWETNDDVTEWTLHLRQGIQFNNGDELTADDVMFTFGEWLNPDVGSSMLGLLAPVLSGMSDVERVDDYTIRLHLSQANVAIPEFLFHYPAIVLHRDFEGDIIRQPVGTGAFTLEEYAEGERAVFRRREDYWQMGVDGQPLPYLDELLYLSSDKDAGVAALQSGQVDTLYDPRPADWQALRDVNTLTVRPVSTAQSLILRMRVDLEPWDDNRVRTALKMCQDREQIFQLAY